MPGRSCFAGPGRAALKIGSLLRLAAEGDASLSDKWTRCIKCRTTNCACEQMPELQRESGRDSWRGVMGNRFKKMAFEQCPTSNPDEEAGSVKSRESPTAGSRRLLSFEGARLDSAL